MIPEVERIVELIKWLNTIEGDLQKIRENAGDLGFGDDPLYLDGSESVTRVRNMVETLHREIGRLTCQSGTKV